jgi:hypothetical protein
VYYYHRVRRISRWDKPDSAVFGEISARIAAEEQVFWGGTTVLVVVLVVS